MSQPSNTSAQIQATIALGRPDPEIWTIAAPMTQPYEALAQTLACGLCSSTDRRVIEGRLPFHQGYPAVLGHESISRILQPAQSGGWNQGSWVTRGCAVWPGVGRDGLLGAWGAMADQVLVRDPQALKMLEAPSDGASQYAAQQQQIPKELPLVGAVLAISVGEVLSWLRRVGSMAGKKVVILGGGFVGYLLVLLCRAEGADQVHLLVRREERGAKARILGADEAWSSDPARCWEVKTALNGGADYLLDASGDGLALAGWCSVVAPGGTVAAFGIPDDGCFLVPVGGLDDGVKFIAPRPKEVEALADGIQLLGAGRVPVSQLLTHVWRWPEDMGEALSAVRAGLVTKGIFLWPGASLDQTAVDEAARN